MSRDTNLIVTITFRIPPSVQKLFPQCSIERVINTSIEIAGESKHIDAHVNYEDWKEMKAPVTSLFEAIKNALAAHRYGQNPHVGIATNPYPISDVNQY